MYKEEAAGELSADEASAIVAEAAGRYFEACRARVRPFVDANFTFRGSLGLHRHAVGLDIVRAPANALLSLPQVGLKLGAAGARALGSRRAARWLEARDLLIETAVVRELRWRIVTDLLRLPAREGTRVSRPDALAEAILAHPRVAALLGEAARIAGLHSADPAFRERLERMLGEYAGTRTAASEIATSLIVVGAGALTFQKATPGALALGPLVATALAQQGAIASFPLGATAGGLWYGVFPATASPFLVAGSTAGLIGAAASFRPSRASRAIPCSGGWACTSAG